MILSKKKFSRKDIYQVGDSISHEAGGFHSGPIISAHHHPLVSWLMVLLTVAASRPYFARGLGSCVGVSAVHVQLKNQTEPIYNFRVGYKETEFP